MTDHKQITPGLYRQRQQRKITHDEGIAYLKAAVVTMLIVCAMIALWGEFTGIDW